MYFTNENLTELYCQRQELLVQESRNRRLARRQLRAARSKGSPRSERRSRVSFGERSPPCGGGSASRSLGLRKGITQEGQPQKEAPNMNYTRRDLGVGAAIG